MVSIEKLINAAKAAGEPPCTAFKCANEWRCAVDSLACEAFALFAETGRAISPYSVLVPGTRKRVQIDMIRATREIFDATYLGDDRVHAKPQPETEAAE